MKKSPKKWANQFFVAINPELVTWKNISQEFVLLLKLPKKLPKEYNRPIGKNSPNLVTLVVANND
jgi:hypothetical protein